MKTVPKHAPASIQTVVHIRPNFSLKKISLSIKSLLASPTPATFGFHDSRKTLPDLPGLLMEYVRDCFVSTPKNFLTVSFTASLLQRRGQRRESRRGGRVPTKAEASISEGYVGGDLQAHWLGVCRVQTLSLHLALMRRYFNA